MKARKKHLIPVYIILAVMAFIMILPFVWTLLTAFKTQSEALQVPPRILPSSWSPRNFESVLQVLPFGKFFYNTFAMIVLRVLGSVFFSALAAFAFARLEFPGKKVLFTMVLLQMMVPGQIFIIPAMVSDELALTREGDRVRIEYSAQEGLSNQSTAFDNLLLPDA